MKKWIAIISLVLGVGMVSGARISEQTYDFKANPKVGDTADYKEVVKLTISAQDVMVETTLHQVINALELNGDLRMTQTESGTSVKVGGQPTQAPESKPQIMTFLASGEVKSVKVEGADANWYRAFNLGNFLKPLKPVKIGESWTRILAPSKELSPVGLKADYKLVAREKVGMWDTLKVTYQVTETGVDTPGTGEGTFWINIADSQLVKEEITLKNAVFPGGGTTPIDISSSLERVK